MSSKQTYKTVFTAQAKTVVFLAIAAAAVNYLKAKSAKEPLSSKPTRTRNGFHTEAMQNVYDFYKAKGY